jgi:TRAP-type uncharacterized transport system substrate-binding protein
MQSSSSAPTHQRYGLWLTIGAVLGILLAIALALALARPLPPRTVLMATGPEGGAYAQVGARYRAIFARHGVALELVATDGSVENVARLRDARSGVSVALVQGGTVSADQSSGLASLGTVFYEPVWLFRHSAPKPKLGQFQPRLRVSMGEPGSGTYKLALELAAATRANLSQLDVRNLTPEEAGQALMNGELDMAAMVSAWESPVVQQLLADKSIDITPWMRADAQVALRPYLNKLVLPRGVIDLASDRPSKDIPLIAPKASLLVREELHPAIQYLLLDTASEVHGAPGIFNRAGQFPAAEPVDAPLSGVARQYYRSGPPFLQRYLPFWLAAFTAQLLVLLIPVAGVLYPLFRLLPAVYGWGMRRRIFRLYRDLKFLDAELDALPSTGEPIENLSSRLDMLERRANKLRMPMAFTYMLYTLKHHISPVRERLERTRSASR